MDRRKIIIASPREPCGSTWLINCFLELGILTYRLGHWQSMWNLQEGAYILSPQEDILKKWLPSLSSRKSFRFRADIEVEWVHEWPTEKFQKNRVILFLRDPRDSLYSRYKRERGKVAYQDYIGFLDPQTLLDKAETNVIFTVLWGQHPCCQAFYFEDYKANPESTLRSVLEWIQVEASTEGIRAALAASTSEKAAEAEKRWKGSIQHDHSWNDPEVLQRVNQGGIVGRWKQLQGDDRRVVDRIQQLRCEILQVESGGELLSSYIYFLRKNKRIGDVLFSSMEPENMDTVNALEERALSFASELTYRRAVDVGLYRYEILELLRSLCDLAFVHRRSTLKNIEEQYRDHFGSTSDLFLGVYERTGRASALLRCGPLYLLRLVKRSSAQLSLRMLNMHNAECN